MENSSPKPKKHLKPTRKFKDADAFLDAVTPIMIENLNLVESADQRNRTQDSKDHTNSGLDKKPKSHG